MTRTCAATWAVTWPPGRAAGGWSTWYARRIDGALGRAAQRAAEQTAGHAQTRRPGPGSTPLGRAFLTVAHNRVRHDGELADQFCRTRSVLDIQGNVHEVARRAGPGGHALRLRDARRPGRPRGHGHRRRPGRCPTSLGKTVYTQELARVRVADRVRRAAPAGAQATSAARASPATALQWRTEYGESAPDPRGQENLRTRVVGQYDSAGVGHQHRPTISRGTCSSSDPPARRRVRGTSSTGPRRCRSSRAAVRREHQPTTR